MNDNAVTEQHRKVKLREALITYTTESRAAVQAEMRVLYALERRISEAFVSGSDALLDVSVGLLSIESGLRDEHGYYDATLAVLRALATIDEAAAALRESKPKETT